MSQQLSARRRSSLAVHRRTVIRISEATTGASTALGRAQGEIAVAQIARYLDRHCLGLPVSLPKPSCVSCPLFAASVQLGSRATVSWHTEQKSRVDQGISSFSHATVTLCVPVARACHSIPATLRPGCRQRRHWTRPMLNPSQVVRRVNAVASPFCDPRRARRPTRPREGPSGRPPPGELSIQTQILSVGGSLAC